MAQVVARGQITIAEVHDGTPSTMYRIVGSVNDITRSMTGELSHTSVKCYVYKITGDAARVLTAEKTLRLRKVVNGVAGSETTIPHPGGVTASISVTSDTDSLEFTLYDSDKVFNDTTLLDRETIPVITDASDIEISSRNLLRQSKEILVQATSTSWQHVARNLTIPLKNGDYLAFMTEGLEVVAGTATEFDVVIYNSNTSTQISNRVQITATNRTAIFRITADEANPRMLFYAGRAGSTAGNSVKYIKAILVKGNVPMQTWSPAPEDIDERVDSFDYVKEAMRNGATQATAGLLLTSLIKLGVWDKSNPSSPVMTSVYAGMNGIYSTERTIASWWGGDMVDLFNLDGSKKNPAPANAATALVRMDGTGYFAKGNIYWNSDGSGGVAGGLLSWDDRGNVTIGAGISVGGGSLNMTLGQVLNYINALNSLLVPVDENGNDLPFTQASKAYALKSVKSFYSLGGITAMGFGSGSSGGGGGGVDILSSWAQYSEDKKEWALSAGLGKGLYDSLNTAIGRIGRLESKTTAVSFTQALSSGKRIGAITIDDVSKDIFAPATYAWTEITSKPTTLTGYGITDVYTKTASQALFLPVVAYNYTSGYLVKLKAPKASNTMVTLLIKGNSYLRGAPAFNSVVQFYVYGSNNSIIEYSSTHLGYDIGDIKAFVYNGYAHVWFKQSKSFQSFAVTAICSLNAIVGNAVESITNAAMPSSGVEWLVNITAIKALRTDNYADILDAQYPATGHTHTFASLTNKPTTIAGYGITDAKIENGTITLGGNTIKPLTTHQELEYIKSIDTRDTATLPNTYGAQLRVNFKRNSTNGLNDGGVYNGELHFKMYGISSDMSGGYPHQLGFTVNGNIWHRIGTGSTTWGSWYKLLDSNNTKISGGVITINGTSITPLTAHQSLANYVTLNTAQSISGKKTFKGGMAITSADENITLPFFLGIESFSDGGTVQYINRARIAKLLNVYTKEEADGRYVNVSGDTMTGLLITSEGHNKGIKIGSSYITSSGPDIVFENTDAFRFGGNNWNYNIWAGLKYVSSDKTIYLGLADGTIFTANTAQSGGRILTPGISDIYVGNNTTNKVLHAGNYTSILDTRYYTESEINAKLTNGSVTKVGTATVGGASRGIYLNAGTPTAMTGTAGKSVIPVWMDNGTIKEVTSIAEAYLSFGGRNITGSLTPIDAATLDLASANRLAFGRAEGITIEYSRDSGATWQDYGASEGTKVKLVSGIDAGIVIGKASSSDTVTTAYQLRVSLNATKMGLYTDASKLLLWVLDNAATVYVKLEISKKGSETIFKAFGDQYRLSGWSAWNSIPLGFNFGGGDTQTNNVAVIRMTFIITDISANYANRFALQKICITGPNSYNSVSNLSHRGHIYTWDYLQHAFFPANVTAPAFIGELQGNAATATNLKTARMIWGQSFDGTANVSGNMSGVDNINMTGSEPTIKRSGEDIIRIADAGLVISPYTTIGFIALRCGVKSQTNGEKELRILSNGNVGLGTASPSHKLHVAGNARVDSFIDCYYTSSSWINGVTNACLNGRYSSYGAILSMPVKDGRVSLSTYPTSTNYVYLGYATNAQISAGTNNFNQKIFWDASANNLHCVAITMDGALTGVTSISASGAISAASFTAGKIADTSLNGAIYGNGYVEIYHSTPFIDFHFGRASGDFTARIIEEASGRLNLKYDVKVERKLYIGQTTNAIEWDAENNAYKVNGSIYATGGVSTLGFGGASGGGGGGVDILGKWSEYDTTKEMWALSAGLGNDLHTRTKYLETNAVRSVSVSGSGNAITAIEKNGGIVTATKGATFLTSHQNIDHLLVNDVRGEARLPSYFSEKRITAWFNQTGVPSNAWYSGIHVKGWTHSYASWELCGNSHTALGSNTNLYFRTGLGSSWGAWQTVLTDKNYSTILDSRYSQEGHKQAFTAAECTSYSSDSNTMGVTPAAVKKAFTLFEPKSHTHSFDSLTSTPTTLAGYGITDAKIVGTTRIQIGSNSIDLSSYLTRATASNMFNPKHVYDYKSGCLVKMKATRTSNNMFTVIITGNSYYWNDPPIFSIAQFYSYSSGSSIINGTIRHLGYDFGDVKAFIYQNQVHMWFKQGRDFQTFFITAYTAALQTENNAVQSITNAAMPSSGVEWLVTLAKK